MPRPLKVLIAEDNPAATVLNGTGDSFLDNYVIISATGLTFDHKGDGRTPNDSGDTDKGPNNLQNAPVITSATHLMEWRENPNPRNPPKRTE